MDNLYELYYIPELEDFQIGLQYQMYNYDKETYQDYKMTFEDFSWVVVKNQIDSGMCRIKLLDEQDLLDLGWKNYENNIWEFPFGGWKLTMEKYLDNNNMFIIIENINVIMKLNIRNKQELLKLMTWLKI